MVRLARNITYMVKCKLHKTSDGFYSLKYISVHSDECHAALSTRLMLVFRWFTLKPRKWKLYVPPKSWLTFGGVHCIMLKNRTTNSHCFQNANFYTTYFAVPMKLVRLIKMCLSETYSKVRMGKHLSESFTIRIDLKQGMLCHHCFTTLL
jgi:hypothetical protein